VDVTAGFEQRLLDMTCREFGIEGALEAGQLRCQRSEQGISAGRPV
jgi:hypothetical protein